MNKKQTIYGHIICKWLFNWRQAGQQEVQPLKDSMLFIHDFATFDGKSENWYHLTHFGSVSGNLLSKIFNLLCLNFHCLSQLTGDGWCQVLPFKSIAKLRWKGSSFSVTPLPANMDSITGPICFECLHVYLIFSLFTSPWLVTCEIATPIVVCPSL